MKIILRIFIAVFTCLALWFPAMQRQIGEGLTIRTHGILTGGYRNSLDQIDVSTTAISILAWIAPALFLLWKWDFVSGWLTRNKKAIGVSAAICSVLFAGIVLILGLYENLYKSKKQDQIKSVVQPVSNFQIATTNAFTLIPTAPATANQVRRATKANP